MLPRLKTLVALGLYWRLTLSASAQSSPLPVHEVRSINPTDANCQDLEFLVREVGPARVLMLGEPTHGEGNVFEAKLRLVNFLQQRLGFTTLAFESGFYDLHKAQQELAAGKPVPEVLSSSVFSVWMNTQEFQGVLPLVGNGKLRVAGFDPQLGGEYSEALVEELQAFLEPDKSSAGINYDYLEEIVSYMGEHFAFLPTAKLADFEQELAKAARLVGKAATGTAAKHRAEAAFWQQCLRSLLAQARDYALHDPNGKDEATFKATDSNPRDAQMADNLLWYLKQHPTEKVICWGALPHLANRVEALNDAELRLYRPMGQAVAAALGPDQVYVLGTLAGGGTHGLWSEAPQPVPAPAAGSLEAELLAQPAEYAFVSLKHDAPGRILTTSALDYKPVTGPWSESVDGFLFLRTVNPPHRAQLVAAGGLPAAAPEPGAAPTALNPAVRRARGTVSSVGAVGRIVQGVVLDRKTGAPVPYASVSVPAQGVGTVADGQGRFLLRATGTVQVSSVGYAAVTVVATTAPLTVRLTPAAYELQDVQVRGESLDPRKIMKKVLAAIPKNYDQGDYATEVYTYRRLSNFDSLRYEGEYVSQVLTPAGHHNLHGGFLGREDRQQHRIREKHIVQASPKGLGMADIEGHGMGFYTGAADPLRTSPLFKPGRWKKYTLRLDSVLERNGETIYRIGFVAKRANRRTTGTYLQSSYSGQFEVQQRDYAVTHYEAKWQGDTVVQNAVARKYVGKPVLLAKLYSNLYTDQRTDHVVDYTRAVNGRYYVWHSRGLGLDAGRVLKTGRRFYVQRNCEQYFTLLPATPPPLPINPKMNPEYEGMETHQLQYTDYRPEFWQTYRRPTAAADASAPTTVKP
ncbi:MAG TPA: erythromycin esterase family protein [Hymenobacter sp.]